MGRLIAATVMLVVTGFPCAGWLWRVPRPERQEIGGLIVVRAPLSSATLSALTGFGAWR